MRLWENLGAGIYLNEVFCLKAVTPFFLRNKPFAARIAANLKFQGAVFLLFGVG
jgi:hypothetical protein